LSAGIEDVGGHDEDQDRKDALQRLFTVRQPIGQHDASEPARDAADNELAGDPPIDQTGRRETGFLTQPLPPQTLQVAA
jgi:hypothetical protein